MGSFRDIAACLALGLGLALAPVARADLDAAPAWPTLRGHVNDDAALLPSDRAAALERRLTAYEQQTGQQFVLLTAKSLGDHSIEEYAVEVFERWKLGKKGKDDGLLLVIVPSERKMRIEVGYGLEGVIPDAIASRVVRDVLTPAFQQGDFAGGIDSAFGALMHVGSGGKAGGAEPSPAPAQRERRHRAPLLGPLVFPLLMFVLFALLGGRGRRRRRGFFIMGPGFGGGFGGGGGGGFGGGFGGGGGGGFSGGGGGSGGGGASGSW